VNRFLSKKKIIILTALTIFLALLAGIAIYIEEQGHFCTITPNEAYRSGQLDTEELQYYIVKYNIKSILNLRGQNTGKLWYTEELKVCKRYGIKHYDIALSKSREPDKKDVHNLIRIFHTAPRPILIHCAGGSDRTGLVSAMWKVIIDNEAKSKASRQLSIWYGHIPGLNNSAMDKFLKRWKPRKTDYSLLWQSIRLIKQIRPC